MKKKYIFIFVSLPFFAFLCEKNGEDTVVGSNKDVEISGLTFTIDRSYISGLTMYANGTVRNESSAEVTSPWFVEGQFYSFYLNQGNTQTYPEFKIGNLRGIYKNQ
jgi:hypothetical protein